VLAAIAAFALVAGCGGGSTARSSESTPPVTTSSLSKAEYVKAADAGCVKKKKGLLESASDYLGKRVSEGVERRVALADLGRAVMLPSVEAEVAVIRKLGAPAGDEGEIEAILAAEQQAIDQVKRLKEAKSVYKIVRHFYAVDRMLFGYGITECTNFKGAL
jgi:hypothetical protein